MDNWNTFQQHNWHNYAWFFCFHEDNENEAAEAHIPPHRNSKTKKPWHRDSKTKKPQHRDSKTKTPRHRDLGSKTPRHWEMEKNKPPHRDSKAFFQRTKSHDIEVPRLKNHDIEILRPKSHNIKFLWNSDPYAPRYPWYARYGKALRRLWGCVCDNRKPAFTAFYLALYLTGVHFQKASDSTLAEWEIGGVRLREELCGGKTIVSLIVCSWLSAAFELSN